VDDLIEPADVPLDGLQQAMEQLMAGELAGKVLVAPGGRAPGEPLDGAAPA